MSVFLAGASGFIGRHLLARLAAARMDVRCGSRDPALAFERQRVGSWVRLDLHDPKTIGPALRGSRNAIYLVHEMAGGEGYGERERQAALEFGKAAAAEGIERIVYLGGVAPQGVPSRHLASRLATGTNLRAAGVPVFELRAAMVIGNGSLSWKIVRDLAARLPAMVLPRWLTSRSQPIGIDDVTFALESALSLPLELAGTYDLPGPEVLTAREILERVAYLRGTRPVMVNVPVLTPRLSSYWLKFVTGADYYVARELIDGLSHNLLATQPEFWKLVPGHQRLSFDEAARRALARESRAAPPGTALLERAVARVSRPTHW